MKSNVKLSKNDLKALYDWLDKNDYETNTEIVDWRVMMWRKNGQKQWTQAYDGLTSRAKVDRDFLRCFGPDENAIQLFYEDVE